MKIIRENFKLDKKTLETLKSKQFNYFFNADKISIFDIETTGLYPKHDKIILIGFVHIMPGHDDGELVQFFAETSDEEENILLEAIRDISDTDILITYNGRSFDGPFLTTRCQKYSIHSKNIFNLDLYQLVRKYSTLKNVIGSLSQKSMEGFMQIDHLRADEISGGESINLYNEYTDQESLSYKSETLLNKILLHNKDDVMQLTRLISLLKYFDLNMAIEKIGFTRSGLIISDYSVSNTLFRINGIQRDDFIDYIAFPTLEFSGKMNFNRQDGSWQAEYPIYARKEGKFVDLSEFKDMLSSDAGKYLNFSKHSIIDNKLILSDYGKQNSIACYDFASLFVDRIEKEINHK
ncbi:MAG: ribonuclease H-like domain-containing protein [Clostridiales bacterium]|nr:ribonuclease H-like domain-containing protein [Clostridiales bacterium]MDY6116362.1 ribonuclease H-like domain-containing protein [Anaerovoracaceae bacterium]